MHFKTIADYYAHIFERFKLSCGNGEINLTTIGTLRMREVSSVNLKDDIVLNPEQFSVSYPQALRYIEDTLIGKHKLCGVEWFLVNFHDDVVNDCVGNGSIKFRQNWKLLLLTLLSINRAAESGNSSLVLYDIYFDWAVHFELSQQQGTLAAEVYERDYKADPLGHITIGNQ